MKDNIKTAVFKAIDKYNAGVDKEKHLEKSEKTELFGQDSKLDSLGFVALIVALEEEISEEFNVKINLAEDPSFLDSENNY